MRILHVWDFGGDACLLSKELQKMGHQSKVIRHAGYDEFGIFQFYDDFILNIPHKKFKKKCLEEAENADIIHFHAKFELLVKISKKFGKSKKIILQYHGSDIRGFRTKENVRHGPSISDAIHKPVWTARRLLKSWKKLNQEVQNIADAVIVSQPDLLDDVPNAEYLPNPIDIEHFKSDTTLKDEQKEALMIKTHLTDVKWAIEYCKKNGIKLDIDIHDRKKSPINYTNMPSFLKKYKTYVDIRYINGLLLTSPSNTAMQALACGLKVLDHNLKWQKNLPEEYYPKNIASKLSSIYSRI